jgi:hypothetical protein
MTANLNVMELERMLAADTGENPQRTHALAALLISRRLAILATALGGVEHELVAMNQKLPDLVEALADLESELLESRDGLRS